MLFTSSTLFLAQVYQKNIQPCQTKRLLIGHCSMPLAVNTLITLVNYVKKSRRINIDTIKIESPIQYHKLLMIVIVVLNV